MAQQEETLDPFPPPSHSSSDQSLSQSSSPSSSDPSLSRNASFSRLNAQAPEFVPTRAPTQNPQQPQSQPQQPPRIKIPSPPSPTMLHVYHPPPPFHVPIQSPVAIPPPHMVPVQNHHIHHHHHYPHNNNHYVPVRNHNHHNQHHQYYGGGDHEIDVVSKNGGGQRKDQKKDNVDANLAGPDSKSGLSDDVVAQKILNQVEYYFSDLNLATTDHLMRYINKDREGYVPISVVASFKKIKALISSNSQLASVLRNSSKLVVSEDGKKVKCQRPITESDMEELQTRIVVAENLPEDHCHQNLMKIFSAVGSVKTIRTCPPQTSSNGASSASRLAKNDGMLLSNKLHAFVEYETIELAEKAVVELNEEGNWRSGLRVRLMLKRTAKDSKPAQGRGRKGHDGEGHNEEEDATTSEQQQNGKPSEDCLQQLDIHSHDIAGEELVNDKDNGQKKGRGRGQGKGRGRPHQYHHNHHSNHHNNRGNHLGTSPSNHSAISEQPIIAKQPPGPRMPDGTRGFALGRGKPISVNTR